MLVGIDEVGRGCWAGPVVAGAVALHAPISGLKDSKQLSRAQRQKLAGIIHQKAAAVGLGWASAKDVDQFGLTAAVRLAMQRALADLMTSICGGTDRTDNIIDEIIIDGNYNFLSDQPNARTVIGGDALIPAISAASIVAKVARDGYMQAQAAAFPQYGFDTHVGYGTARHRQALFQHGVCALHRRSFRPIAASFARTAA